MVRLFKILLLLCAFVICFSSLIEARQQYQEPEVSVIFRNIAEITDPASIEIIIDDFLITEFIEDIERIEVIDVSNIGFGTNDILVVHPSRNVYLLDSPSSPELLETMQNWTITEQRRDASNVLSADDFYPTHADTLESWELEETQIELVQNSLISDVLTSLNRNYTELPISFRFERDHDGFTFQMWNYDEDAFLFTPRPPGVADSVAVNDFLYVLYSDSTVVADTTLYDVIYINKTIQETIHVPEIEEQEIIQTQTLPGSEAFINELQNLEATIRRE
ncbi:MAG: hypothetical protein JJU13_13710 [Balneolaceae bacterium]|nr:hypothetical protein [Balneolaceae bacterium]